MRFSLTLLLATCALSHQAVLSKPQPAVAPALWDGSCFYPVADEGFTLDSYAGTWYQVAGTLATFTAGCRCIHAQYSVNKDGSVKVVNICERNGRLGSITGVATLADARYGKTGVFQVHFPHQRPSTCPGPNYIIQEYKKDLAIVQSSNFSNVFILSRSPQVDEATLSASTIFCNIRYMKLIRHVAVYSAGLREQEN
ncbi:hypothetical protein UVI_02062090 [Ustilaginoidea virens]|uniref:Lipocalin/cytosolic fatty-acid binding domain-containing protein n=1 Tax=Ustilaginoidea virens TaxID=1159556 RepID=A0A1B5L7P3_USTVR|nr:hypothetical protein UVI_02062090 [Ustilaginoidea virens]